MNDYFKKEEKCQSCFNDLGPCYHLWTPENFEIIFRNDEEFKIGMGAVAIAAKLFPEVKVITFELMTNHLHVVASGVLSRILEMIDTIKQILVRMSTERDRTICWSAFKVKERKLETLSDIRNVIVYDNRNGFLVRPDYTPFTYPWGANKCFYNSEAKKRFEQSSRFSTCRERRSIIRSHLSDDIQGLRILDGFISPFSFCDFNTGEGLFRDAAQYFYLSGKNIEQNVEIAKEIGESILYTDDELYAAISSKCKKDYSTGNLAQLESEAKINVAIDMKNNYNATAKQIQRMLRLDNSTIQSLFGK